MSRQIDFVATRSRFFIISGVLVVLSLVMLAIPPALRPGIEFTSGTTMLIEFEEGVEQQDLRAALTNLGFPEARIQSTSGKREYLIRTRELQVPPGAFTELAPEPTVVPIGPVPLEPIATLNLGDADGEADGDVFLREPSQGNTCQFGDIAGTVPWGTEGQALEVIECPDGPIYHVIAGDFIGYIRATDAHNIVDIEEPAATPEVTADAGERTLIEQRLLDDFGTFTMREFASVSPTVSAVAVRNAAIAVTVASLFIMGYVAFAFATVPQPFRYAVCAIVALAHDVIITLGAFSLLGKLFGVEVNLMFVTGLLTVIGFSVHDSIVVFDRIRENVRAVPTAALRENVNAALLQTMARSFNTSLTLLLTAVAMLLLGGATIQSFLLVIVIGVTIGTFSSIALAAQLLVAWDEGDFNRIFRRGRKDAAPAA
ncbi:MAG: protein translocase subunit SecF [Chloroflexi bacterium]|nr:protein translocase subunit SecF [Chloroflexota bacterium]MQC47647.1 protein translocase subunit SecF [Chloroflexota bacterium]